jgi:hypothetical protein
MGDKKDKDNVPPVLDGQREPAAAGQDEVKMADDADDEDDDVIVLDKSNTPWPYLDKFFPFVGRKEGSIQVKCSLCSPKVTLLKAHISSLSNLRTHVHRMHTENIKEFEKAMNEGRKRTSVEPAEGPSHKKKKQLTISSWGRSSRRATQDGVDRRIVDLFVAGMLPLQVMQIFCLL